MSGARHGGDDRLPAADGRRARSSRSLPIRAIRIVSLTITEGGYFIDPALRQVRSREPGIVADAKNPDAPEDGVRPDPCRADAPARRRHRAVHGDVLRQHPAQRPCHLDAVVGLAGRRTTRFAGWVRDNVAFPNAMVDRITPATTDRERAITRDEFGIEDDWPVFCEPFMQWVLEDISLPAARRWKRSACSSSTMSRPSSR